MSSSDSNSSSNLQQSNIQQVQMNLLRQLAIINAAVASNNSSVTENTVSSTLYLFFFTPFLASSTSKSPSAVSNPATSSNGMVSKPRNFTLYCKSTVVSSDKHKLNISWKHWQPSTLKILELEKQEESPKHPSLKASQLLLVIFLHYHLLRLCH